MLPFRAAGSPVQGPSTVQWLCRFMLNNGGSPMGFHSKFMSESRLDYGASGTSEHMSLCKFLEIAICHDQLDVSRSAGVEMLCRKIQIIHDMWKHKFPGFSASAADRSGAQLGKSRSA